MVELGLDGFLRRRRRAARGDTGAAVPEFLMVSIVLLFLTLLIVQAALYLYVRNVATESAASGARYAANANAVPAAGAGKASELLARGTSRSVADRVSCTGSEEAGEGGATVTVVHCSGKIPALFLPGAGVLPIDVRARALKEGT